MALITFMSDFGTSDYYIAAVKGSILSVNPSLKIIDISHTIEKFDIGAAAYALKSVAPNFPKGTVHLVAVNSVIKPKGKYIAIKLEGQFYVGADNGIFSLVSEKKPELAVEILKSEHNNTSFPANEIFAKVAAKIASGERLENIGKPISEIKEYLNPGCRATKAQITGSVINIDNYGNLITNIEKKVFDILHKDRNYRIIFARERFSNIMSTLNEVEDGECYVIFNSLGNLEIGINKGNASELLGLKVESAVNIMFEEQ